MFVNKEAMKRKKLLLLIISVVFLALVSGGAARYFQTIKSDPEPPTVTVNNFAITIAFYIPVEYQVTVKRLGSNHSQRRFSGFTDEDRIFQILRGELEPGKWHLQIMYIVDNQTYWYETEVIVP